MAAPKDPGARGWYEWFAEINTAARQAENAVIEQYCEGAPELTAMINNAFLQQALYKVKRRTKPRELSDYDIQLIRQLAEVIVHLTPLGVAAS